METQELVVNISPEIEKTTKTAVLDLSAQQIWQDCLNILRTKLSNLNFKTWIEPIVPLKIEQNNFFLQVPSPFFFEWIEEHFYKTISDSLAQAYGKEISVQYIISQDEDELNENVTPAPSIFVTPKIDEATMPRYQTIKSTLLQNQNLNRG